MTRILFLALILLILLLSFQLIFGTYPKNSPPLPNLLTELSPNPSPLPYPTIDSIFSPDHSWVKNLDPNKTVTLIATGDIIPARVTNIRATQKNDFNWAFANIAEVLKNADLTFINLETPLITNCPLMNDGFKFCGDIRHVQGLIASGVDIASLANNHAANFGIPGVEETKKLLEKNQIAVTGIDGPLLKEVKGINFAFFGYNDVGKFAEVSQADDQKICEDIKSVRNKVDIIVVTYHWGIEYRSQPDERQKELGHLTIDCGADLVIGNHPHWIQPVEFYKDKLITYAHGNTVFDQEWSQKTKEGVIGRYTFFDKKLVDVEYLPLLIKDFGQPSFLEGEAKQKILEEMKKESEILQNSRE